MSVTHGPVHHCISFSHILSLLGDIEHTVKSCDLKIWAIVQLETDRDIV